MRTKAYWILVILIIIGLLVLGRSGLALDLDYETLCTNTLTKLDVPAPPALNGIFSTLEEAVDIDTDGDEINDSMLLCFDGDDLLNLSPYSLSLNIAANPSETPLIVYNMNLVMVADGQVVVGDNVIFDNVQLTGSATSPLKITGSDVQILNSPGIEASSVGVLIQDTSGVAIHNSTITGPGMEEVDSIGVNVVNSTGIEITDNPDTIEDFGKGIEFDVNSDVIMNNVTFNNVAQLIVGDGVTVDFDNSVGKKLDDEDNVIRIAGFLPDVECGDEISENGQVEMYRQSELDEFQIASEANCEVRKSTSNEICLFIGDGVSPADEEEKLACIQSDECACSEADSCIFDCTVEISPEGSIAFVYSNSAGISAPFSSFKQVGLLSGIIATYAPSVPVAAPEEELTDSGDDTGGNRASAEADGGGDGDAPLGGALGMAKGCSLTKNAAMTIPPFIVLLSMILIPVAVRIRSRSRKRRK